MDVKHVQNTYRHMSMNTYVEIIRHVHMYGHVHMYVCVHTHMHIQIQTCVLTYMRVCCAYVHTCLLLAVVARPVRAGSIAVVHVAVCMYVCMYKICMYVCI
jgi:hypothetical protein